MVWRTFLFSAALVATATSSAADEFAMRRPQAAPKGIAEVIGGRPALPSKWPATFQFMSNGNACTSTLIGPRAILTAAHCLKAGQTGTIELDGTSTLITCSTHPRYTPEDHNPGTAFDIALCHSDAPIVLPADSRYERINTHPSLPKVDTSLVLLGYGCRDAAQRASTGYLYEGQASVINPTWMENYIEADGGAMICAGDSGGAAYIRVNEYRRVIVGVNSRTDYKGRSYISAVAHDSILQFIREWARDKSVMVCGLNEAENKCHE